MSKKLGPEEIKVLVDATVKIILTNKDKSDSLVPEIYFLNQFVKQLVDSVLGDKSTAKESKQVQFETMKHNYETLKHGVQEAIALAFQDSMQKFSKNAEVEYYCTIKTVPQPISDKVH